MNRFGFVLVTMRLSCVLVTLCAPLAFANQRETDKAPSVTAEARIVSLPKAAQLSTFSDSVKDTLVAARSMEISGQGLSVSSDGSLVAFGIDSLVKSEPLIKIISRRDAGFSISIQGASWPAVSPDGKEVAYWSTQSGERQIWIWGAASRRAVQLTHVIGGVKEPTAGYDLWYPENTALLAWSADSQQLAFSRAEVVSAPFESHAARPWLAANTSVKAFFYSSNDRFPHPLYRHSDEGRHTGSGRFWYDLSGEIDRLEVVNVSTGGVRQITFGPHSYVAPVWAPNGDFVVAITRDTQGGLSITSVPTLAKVSLGGGGVDIFPQLDVHPMAPSISPDGRRVAYEGWLGAYGMKRLYIVDLTSKRVRQMAYDREVVNADFTWASARQLRVAVRDGLEDVLLAVDPDTGVTMERSRVKAVINALQYARGSKEELSLRSEEASPVSVYVDRPDKSEAYLYKFEPSGSGVVRPRYLPLSWHNGKGQTLVAMLYLPAGIPGRPLPLVVDTYPKIAGWGYRVDSLVGTPVLLSHGYAVLYTNARGPHVPFDYSSSESFTAEAMGPTGIDLMADDLKGAIQAATDTGLIDPANVCAYGFSNGGATLSYFITRSNLLKCAIIHAPVLLDWSSSYAQGPNGIWLEAMSGGKTPLNAAEFYREMSVYPRIGYVSTPVLLVGGGKDESVTLDAISFFGALRHAHKDADLIIYDDDTHTLSVGAMADFWTRVLVFLASHNDSRPAAHH